MADTLNAVSLFGSLRKGSFNAALARLLPKLAPPDLKIAAAPHWDKFPLYNADDEGATGFPAPVQALADAIRNADAVIVVSPEYNYGLPGGLKNAIDWVSRTKNQPFKDKPVSIMSATGGPLGGARVQYQWRQVMVFLEAHTFNKPEIFVGSAQNKFDDKLELKDQPTTDFVKQHLAAFEKFIRKVGGKG
jgi:chromate reductase, NAD(P)H dehydrogenase (quinone)